MTSSKIRAVLRPFRSSSVTFARPLELDDVISTNPPHLFQDNFRQNYFYGKFKIAKSGFCYEYYF